MPDKERKNKPLIIDNLFPISRNAMNKAFQIGDEKYIKRQEEMFKNTNPHLFLSMFLLGNFYKTIVPDSFEERFYNAGMEMGYLAMTKEAEERGGILPRIERETIDQFIVDKLQIPTQSLKDGETPMLFLNSVIKTIRKVDEKDLNQEECEKLPDWNRLFPFVKLHLKEYNNNLLKRIKQLSLEEKEMMKVLTESVERLPTSVAVSYHMGFTDTYFVFKTNFEINKVRKLLSI